MDHLLQRLWADDCGALIATEWVFVATILVLGIISGLVAVRQAVLTELTNFADAVLSLNMSYSFSGQSNCEASTAGSAFSQTLSSIGLSHVNATVQSISITPCD